MGLANWAPALLFSPRPTVVSPPARNGGNTRLVYCPALVVVIYRHAREMLYRLVSGTTWY